MRHLGARLSAFVDGELSDAQRERVLAHLAGCEPCRHEAAALRLLKQRMHTLADTTAGDTLTWRLIALAGQGGQSVHERWPAWAHAHHRRRRWSLVAAGVATGALGLSAAAFLAGGDQAPAGPRVVPAVDVFMVQHAITTGEVPVPPARGKRSSGRITAGIP